MVQSGLLTDRSRSIRETIEHLSVIKGLQNESINIVSNKLNSDESTSKLIKILLPVSYTHLTLPTRRSV